MKNPVFNKLLLIVTLVVSSTSLHSQYLDLSQWELNAHYNLSENGIDITENYGPIELENPTFNNGGVLSIGCYVGFDNFGDSCLIETPSLYNTLNKDLFAIQVDFRIIESDEPATLPIFMAGNMYRFLGLESFKDSLLVLRTNNIIRDPIEGIELRPDVWYNAAVIHNKLDSMTYVYLDQELVFSKTIRLIYPASDNKISNTSFSNGKVFKGYLKNLKLYSKNNGVSVNSNKSNTALNVYPNPSNQFIKIDPNYDYDNTYMIFNLNGKCVVKSNVGYGVVDISGLSNGTYLIGIFDNVNLLSRNTFTKSN